MNTSSIKATFFASPEQFRIWLKKNHKTCDELIVGYYKVNSGKPSITWPESVEQALCFGWIDGIRRTIDKDSYCIRFTPRRANSIWSQINIKKVKELEKAGLMTQAGMDVFKKRKAEKQKLYSHEKPPDTLSAEYERQFKKNKKAWDFFTAQAPSYKKLIIHWIMSAKRDETRTSRLRKVIQTNASGKRM